MIKRTGKDFDNLILNDIDSDLDYTKLTLFVV